MPAKLITVADAATERLIAIGARLRAHRKALDINATVTAEAAGVSRVTLHRIERGEASVAIGAYLNVAAALGLDFDVAPSGEPGDDRPQAPGWIPARVRVADYPQLRQLAWQVKASTELTPAEALSIYERNWRHVDLEALPAHERNLIDALRVALGKSGDVQ